MPIRRVRFSWKPVPDADRYRFTLATDPRFRAIVHDAELSGTEFVHGRLEAGSYFWRVVASRGDLESDPSRARGVRLVSDETLPNLAVEWPVASVKSGRFLVHGTTEPGAHVFVGSHEVAVSGSGTFSHELDLQRGASIVVVEAVDPVGNTTYESRLIHAETRPMGRKP